MSMNNARDASPKKKKKKPKLQMHEFSFVWLGMSFHLYGWTATMSSVFAYLVFFVF